jgi:hypothetical protein
MIGIKSVSLVSNATPRRSTSSLGSLQRGLSIEVDDCHCCSYNKSCVSPSILPKERVLWQNEG